MSQKGRDNIINNKITCAIIAFTLLLSFSIGALSVIPENSRAISNSKSSWPMFGGNTRHTGRSPYNTSQLNGELKWKFNAGSEIDSSAAVGNYGTIYFGDEKGKLYSLDSDGNKHWEYDTDRNIGTTPAIGDYGRIYMTSGKLHVLYQNGTKVASSNLGGTGTSPVVDSEGSICILTKNSVRIFVLNSTDVITSRTICIGDATSPAIGFDGDIYFGVYDSDIRNGLIKYDPNGNKSWNFHTREGVHSSPAIDEDGIVYFGTDSNRLYALDENGSEQWNFTTEGNIRSSPAIGENGMIYFGCYDNYLYSLNPDGTLNWKFKTDGSIHSSPAISGDGTIYFGSYDNTFYAVNPNGTLKWKYETGARIRASPVIGQDGTVYIGSEDGYLYAFGLSDTKDKDNNGNTPGFGIITSMISISIIAIYKYRKR